MPFRRTRKVLPMGKTGEDVQAGNHGSGNLFVGFKGCPVDLFAAQVAKMPHGDWYKMNKVPQRKRETTKASKDSRIHSDVEYDKHQQTRHGAAQEADSPRNKRDGGGQGIINEDNAKIEGSKTNILQRCCRRFCAFFRMSFQRIPIKRHNKVVIVFDDIGENNQK